MNTQIIRIWTQAHTNNTSKSITATYFYPKVQSIPTTCESSAAATPQPGRRAAGTSQGPGAKERDREQRGRGPNGNCLTVPRCHVQYATPVSSPPPAMHNCNDLFSSLTTASSSCSSCNILFSLSFSFLFRHHFTSVRLIHTQALT